MLPTSPAPHIVVCAQRKQQLGPNMRPRDVLAGAVWKVTAATTEVFEHQTVCVPHSYLWPRRPPPPTHSGSVLETEQNSEPCGYHPASPEPSQTRPAHNAATKPAYLKPDKPTNPTYLSYPSSRNPNDLSHPTSSTRLTLPKPTQTNHPTSTTQVMSSTHLTKTNSTKHTNSSSPAPPT